MRDGTCHHPRRRQRRRFEFCSYQGRIRANGWHRTSDSWRGFLEFLKKTDPRPCSSPRRNQCRRGTTRPGRDQDPARWSCSGREIFQGPILWDPIDDAVWYERPKKPRMRVPVTGGRWNWFDADLEGG